MTEKDLLQFCRYYDGTEREIQDRQIAALSAIEKMWIRFTLNEDEQLHRCLEDYRAFGMSEFEMFDDTPLSLKSLLFNRYNNERTDIEGFKIWYKKFYSKLGN